MSYNFSKPLLSNNGSPKAPRREASENLPGINFSIIDINYEMYSTDDGHNIQVDPDIPAELVKYVNFIERYGGRIKQTMVLKILSNLVIQFSRSEKKAQLMMVQALVDRSTCENEIHADTYIKCIRNSYIKFKRGLDEGGDPNGSSDSDTITLLNITSELGYIDMTAYLIEKGALVNNMTVASVNSPLNGSTSLHFACSNLRPKTVKLLLEKGANPNMKDRDGVTPLMIATALGFKDIVEILIRHGASGPSNYTSSKPPAPVNMRENERAPLLSSKGGRRQKTRKMYKKSKKSRRKYVR